MNVHHMHDYRPDPHTAANSIYPPEAPMIEWADCDDYTDAHIDRVPEYDARAVPWLVGGCIGAFVALVILSALPVPL